MSNPGPGKVPQVVALTGLPASGKSTLGMLLATSLGYPFFDKDTFLEVLFERKRPSGVATRISLSREADIAFEAEARKATSAVVASWWRHPKSTLESGTPPWWLHAPVNQVVEVHCECRPEEATRRFMGRTRHAGHVDGRWRAPELLAMLAEQSALGPLLGHRAIVCNTQAASTSAQVAALAQLIASRLVLASGA